MSVAAVEIEVSLQFYEQQAKDGEHTFFSARSVVERNLMHSIQWLLLVKNYPFPSSHIRTHFRCSSLRFAHPRQSTWSRVTHWSYQEPGGLT